MAFFSNKYIDQYSPIITNILLLEYQIISRKDYINNFKYNQWLEDSELNFDELEQNLINFLSKFTAHYEELEQIYTINMIAISTDLSKNK